MNLSSGYPFELVKNGLPYDYPILSNNIVSDVVIIGGGISGALTAYLLVNAGVNCVMIDGRTIGLGSTCASTSLLQYEIDVPLIKLQADIGISNAIRAYYLGVDAIEKLQGVIRKIKFEQFSARESLYYAANEKDNSWLLEESALRIKHGLKAKYIDAPALKKQYGMTASGAILSSPAAQTNAYLLTHALLQHSIKKGVKVFDRTLATKITHHKTSVTIETGDGAKLKAKKLVYANGYEAVQYVDKKIVDLISTYACASVQANEEFEFWKDEVMIWNTANPYLYMRTTDDRRIIVGGRDEKFYNPIKRDKLLPVKTRQLAKDFNTLFPHTPFKPEFSWTGTFGSTKDGLPFIGNYKKLPNSLFALGFGGNGITFSMIAAEIITAMITGKKSQDEDLFSFDRL